MHLLIIYTGEFQTKTSPIGGIFQFNQAKVLKSKGFKVGILNPCIISPRHILKKFNLNKNSFIRQDIPVYQNYKRNLIPSKIKPLNIVLKKKYEKISLDIFKSYVKKNGYPDLCHVFDVRFGLVVGSLLKKKYNIPYIFTEYCVETANNTLPVNAIYKKKYIVPQLKEANLLALPSKMFALRFKKYFNLKKNIFILPPVLPPDLEIKRKKRNNKKYTFIVVSRLDKNKNIITPLKAFLKLKQKDTNLVIIGNGPEYKNLKKIINKNNVKILKNSSRLNMLQYLSKANCLLCSSRHETFGVGLIEAAFFGLRLISSKCEGPSEIVNKINGVLVKKNNIKSYYDAMNKIIKSDDKYNNNKIKNDIINRFGSKTFISKYLRFINKTIK